MEATNTNNFNGNGRSNNSSVIVIGKEMVTDMQKEGRTVETAPVEAPFIAPEAPKDEQGKGKKEKGKGKKPLGFILAGLGVGAVVAGRIGRKNVEVGNRVQAGTPLMAVVNNEYWVVANFKETQLENMKPGQRVEVKLDSFPHHAFKGKVDSISPASGAQFALLPPDNATGNFTKIVQRIPVKIVFDPASIKGYDSRITPGMSAEVSVEVK